MEIHNDNWGPPMLLSDKDILREIKKGTIVIDPFNREQLQTNGYDVRVGPVYYVLRDDIDVFFPFVKDLIKKVYERRKAKEETIDIEGCRIRGRFIKIPPHGFVLAATLERTKTTENIVPSLRCRSSLSRAGISIARCAGLGDIGFDGVWTMGVVNHLPVTYYLPVGLRVGQIVFMKTESPAEKAYAGKYLGDREPALPKLYADKDLATLLEINNRGEKDEG
ncbi:MAG: dCTP deaminase [Hadesarchaea archaeon]|nr:dCTP deaminase [Hadesarchaea archaeon]